MMALSPIKLQQLKKLFCLLKVVNGGTDGREWNRVFVYSNCIFFFDICLYAAARKTRAKKYEKAAKRCLSKLQSFVKKGNPNAVHHAKILKAQKEALRSNKRGSAFQLFQEAILLATRSGYLQDVALANEWYAELLLEVDADPTDQDEAKYRLEESIKYYTEWGANGKIEIFRKKYYKTLNSM